jgi:hypothetical protein
LRPTGEQWSANGGERNQGLEKGLFYGLINGWPWGQATRLFVS